MSAPSLHNLDAEQAVLGALLAFNKALWSIEDMGLRPEQFYDPVHGRLYHVITGMIREGQLADGVTLHNRLQSDEGLKEIGGVKYLMTLLDASCDPAAIRDYVMLILNLSTKREVMRIANEAIASVMKPDTALESAAQIVEETARALTALETGSEYRSVSAAEAINEALTAAQNALKENAAPNGLSTGLRKLQLKCGLLKPGMVVTIAGRPGMGKSTVALDICLNMAKQNSGAGTGVGIGYLSPEMDASEHGYRMASSIAFSQDIKIPYEEMSDGTLNLEQLRQIAGCAHAAKKLSLVIDDRGIVPFESFGMRARALDRQLRQRFGTPLQVLVIDHLGLIDAPKGGFGGNRVQDVSAITKMIKQFARSMGIVIIMLSQLNRKVEEREDKRPKLSDLRESGSIEQDSDQVWLLYREAYYLEKDIDALKAAGKTSSAEYEDLRTRYRAVKDDIEIDVAKRRGGRRGREKLHLYVPYSAVRDFQDTSNESYPSYEGIRS
jgi:replicative DNA helicase